MGTYLEGPAKTRLDALARWLETVWTAFLMYAVMAQGHATGLTAHVFGYDVHLLPRFHLDKSEFIAVFTTTTAAVFGFLVIVANHLFKGPTNGPS